MFEIPDRKDYARRAADELEAASMAQTRDGKRQHLDQAAIFSTLDEEARRLCDAAS